jgi:CheY-like chemotaxis protein
MNGLELVQYLEEMPDSAMLPACIVLDLNMPVWDGMHTLKVLKQHKSYHFIPTFIFSTSSSDRDMALAESLGAIAYITKPYGQKELLEVCREFAEYCEMEPRRKAFRELT